MAETSNKPNATDPALERGRLLFAGDIQFVRGVVDIAGLPEADRDEIAFAGRSNVGKSSLINALCGRKALARTSNTPGRTRELNFFTLGAHGFLVDMPGYGYARAAQVQVDQWNRLIRDYLAGRANLKRVFLLIDARHGLKPADHPILALLDEAAVSYQAVLTKADKVKPQALEDVDKALAAALASRPAAHPERHITSSVTGLGLEALRADIAGLVRA
jgi:GTP-binding protein